MTPEEIKRNAPDGATHYLVHNREVIYYRERNNQIKLFACGGWFPSGISDINKTEPL